MVKYMLWTGSLSCRPACRSMLAPASDGAVRRGRAGTAWSGPTCHETQHQVMIDQTNTAYLPTMPANQVAVLLVFTMN